LLLLPFRGMPLRALDKGAVRQFLDPRQFVPAKPSLHWELAVPGGLRPWPEATVWQSGHVTAVVPWGKDELLVGTHSGGVWHLKRTCLLAAK